MRASPRLFALCALSALAACGPRSLVDRAREVGMVGAPASAAPDSAPPAATPSDADAPPASAAAALGRVAALAPVRGKADPAVFEGCAGRRVDAANEFIGCPGFLASVHRPQGYSVEAALDTLIADAKHGGHGPDKARAVEQTAYRYQLDDQVLPGRRYQVRHASGQVDSHVAVALEGRGGKVLIGHCHAEAQLGHAAEVIDGTCRAAIATILTGQVPASIYLAEAPYADGMVVGRALTVPAGCERRSPKDQRIRCGEGGQLSWYQARTSLVPLPVVAQAKTQAINGSAVPDKVKVSKPDVVDCTVEGVKTRCIHHRLDIEGEPVVHFYQARVEVRDDTLYAICSGTDAKPDGKPPTPCDQVFQW